MQLCPGAWQLIHRASQAGRPVVVITNQSGILRLSLAHQLLDRGLQAASRGKTMAVLS